MERDIQTLYKAFKVLCVAVILIAIGTICNAINIALLRRGLSLNTLLQSFQR